jgi:hypothetical protein
MRESRLRVIAGRRNWEEKRNLDEWLLPPIVDFPNLSKVDLEQVLLAIDLFPRCALLLSVFEGLRIAQLCNLLNADKQLIKIGQAQGAVELARQIASQYGLQADRPFASESVTTNCAGMTAVAASGGR